MDIKVLGTGCANCAKLEAMTREVVRELGVDATVEMVKDITRIVQYGVMHLPALVIDNKVRAVGVPPRPQLVSIITTVLAES